MGLVLIIPPGFQIEYVVYREAADMWKAHKYVIRSCRRSRNGRQNSKLMWTYRCMDIIGVFQEQIVDDTAVFFIKISAHIHHN